VTLGGVSARQGRHPAALSALEPSAGTSDGHEGEISVNPDSVYLGDRYELTDLLATGGMWQVWRARDLALERPVAVKVLHSAHADDPASFARFLREARLAARLTHPNVATVHDYGEEWLSPERRGEQVAFLVMELVDGEPLSALLRREGRLTPARTMRIVRDTAAGLAAAHAAGVVHRDVKPSNLLVGPDGSVTITDFGIAWSRSSDPLTGTGNVMGTAQYLSPEQARGTTAGPASDVYALGLVAYECLAGRRPFDGASAVQVALMHASRTPAPLPADVPEKVRELVARMLAKDPEKRSPDGAALLSAVDELLRGSTALAASPRPSRRPRHAASSRRPVRRLLMALVAVAALVASVAAVLAGAGRAPAPVAGAGSTPTTSAAIQVATENYLGRPVAEVEAELRSLGLPVQLRAVRTADASDGAVLDVDPTGDLSPGQAVTVTHAVAPPAPAPSPVDETAPAAGTPDPEATTSQPLPEATGSQPLPDTGVGRGHSGRRTPAAPSNGGGNG
jgi:serine/threonine-protein kinase